MSGLVDALLIVVAVIVVIARQFRASRIDTGRRWWLLPVILAVVALREAGLVDPYEDPSTLEEITNTLSVSIALPGPTSGSQLPAPPPASTMRWLEVYPCVTSTTLRPFAARLPYVV